jgi:hypothetical protein
VELESETLEFTVSVFALPGAFEVSVKLTVPSLFVVVPAVTPDRPATPPR